MLGLGTVLGTLSFGQLQPRGRRGVLSYWIWVVNSLCLAGVAFVPWFAAAAGLSVMRGFLIGFGVALWETMMMELVPNRLLSRVVSLDYFGSYELMPVGLALSAGVSGFAGPAELIGGGPSSRRSSSSRRCVSPGFVPSTSPSSRPARRVQ